MLSYELKFLLILNVALVPVFGTLVPATLLYGPVGCEAVPAMVIAVIAPAASLLTCVTVIVASLAGLAPLKFEPGITNCCPTAYPEPGVCIPSVRSTV